MRTSHMSFCFIILVLIQAFSVHSAIAPNTTEQKKITAEANAPNTKVSTGIADPFAFDIGALKKKQSAFDDIIGERSKWTSVLLKATTDSTTKDGSNLITGSSNQVRGKSNTV